MRTDCFHFFHIECLTHYVEYSLAEIGTALEEKLKLNPHAEPDVVVSFNLQEQPFSLRIHLPLVFVPE